MSKSKLMGERSREYKALFRKWIEDGEFSFVLIMSV